LGCAPGEVIPAKVRLCRANRRLDSVFILDVNRRAALSLGREGEELRAIVGTKPLSPLCFSGQTDKRQPGLAGELLGILI
jgi:hypothetical protein